jgi:serine phosphatase RsbU (regulator of sigma subunit)
MRLTPPPAIHRFSAGGRAGWTESNGLLIGVIPDPEYPVCEFSLNSGGRFLLYTDGVVEPENAAGDSFGDSKLEEVIAQSRRSFPAADVETIGNGAHVSA